jgi:hypothetical protein
VGGVGIAAAAGCWRIVGAESTRPGSFFDRASHGFRPVLADEFEQFLQLT